ncbi:MAG: hypothetical protein KUG77_09595 [Nannocystaceae bacterium]|nr:hypothetical protein [Nannocystaceae bacterium]
MSPVRTWPVLALALLASCKSAAETKSPGAQRSPAAHARVDLIPSSAMFLISADVAAFSDRGYRALLPWLDDSDQPEKVSEVRSCYAGDVETAAFGGIFEEPVESMRVAAVLTGPGLGATPVVTCFRRHGADSELAFEIWSEDANTLIVSSKPWVSDVRAKSAETSEAPLSGVLEHVDTDAHAWFAVRLPPSADEQLRSSANWLSEFAAKSTDQATEVEPTATPSRDGIGYVAGSMHLDDEGLDGRVLTTFETRESVDLAHAVLDIGFVLVKHLGASPKTASERLAHEFALHTTISRSGDRIEARTRMSAQLLADAADQAHDTLDVKRMLGLGEADEDPLPGPTQDFDTGRASSSSAKPPSPLAMVIAEAAGPHDRSDDGQPAEVDSELVYDACAALETHLYPLEGCSWNLEDLLQGDDGTATRMLRCVADSGSQADVLACDTNRLLNPAVAQERDVERSEAVDVARTERARKALRKALAAAKTDAEKNTIYAEICERMAVISKMMGKSEPPTQADEDECIETAKKHHASDRDQFELMSTCALLYDEQIGFMGCLSAVQDR